MSFLQVILQRQRVVSYFKMKTLTLPAVFPAVPSQNSDAFAFPAILDQWLANPEVPRLKARSGAPTGGATDTEAATLGSDAAKQYVDNTGTMHSFHHTLQINEDNAHVC